MKAHDLIHGGLYLIGENQIVRFNALNGGFYTLDGHLFGNPFADAESGEIECFTINKHWLKISPIPLTPESLDKNGFEDKTDDFWKLRVDDKPYHYYFRLDKGGTFGGDGYNMKCNIYIITIKYVHELQRALRLCGLIELADSIII